MESIPNITSDLNITLEDTETELKNSDNTSLKYKKSEHFAGNHKDIIKYLKYVSPKSSNLYEIVESGKPAVLIIW